MAKMIHYELSKRLMLYSLNDVLQHEIPNIGGPGWDLLSFEEALLLYFSLFF